jgi:hypothetical protein
VSKNKKPKLTPEQKEFISFLKSKRLYSAYLRNTGCNPFTSDTLLNNKGLLFSQDNPCAFIDGAFMWADTPRGMGGWDKVNKLWRAILNEKAKP